MTVFDRLAKSFLQSFVKMQSYHVRSGSYIFDKKEDAEDAYEVISKIRSCLDRDENRFLPITRMGGTLSDIVYFISEIISYAEKDIIIFDDNIRNSLQRRPYFASPAIIGSLLGALKNGVSLEILLKGPPDGGTDRNLLLLSLLESGAHFYAGVVDIRNINRCRCMFIVVDSKRYIMNVGGEFYGNVNDQEYGEKIRHYADNLRRMSSKIDNSDACTVAL